MSGGSEEELRGKTKLIKTSKTRTSQACDRCRIKKIKCDGALPSCTNCLKIGYDCKISDKLTRRAFPRGYTENLERDLISLQNEIIKLNDELNQYKKQTNENQNPDLAVNFFKFDNYLLNNQYLGLNSVQRIFNDTLVSHQLFTDIKEAKDDENTFIGDFLLDNFIKNFPSKHNMDLIIQHHFTKLNKLFPIINETSFFDTYKQGLNSYNHDYTIQLILIVQLNCSIFSIHDIHKLITNQFNIISSPNLVKFENLLLSLWLFHNKNCYASTVISISNLLKSSVLNLGLHLNYNNLITNIKDESKEEKFKSYSHRLNLYWCFHMMNRLTSIIYGLPDSLFFESFHIPKLSTLVNFNESLKYPLKFIELLDYDCNILSPSPQTTQFIQKWSDSLETEDIDDPTVKLQLKLFALTFKILIKLDPVENSRNFLQIMMELNSVKETGFNSFEFHFIPLNFVKIIIISLFNLLPPNFDKSLAVSTEDRDLIRETVYQSLKLRYPENFILFKEVLQYIISTAFNKSNDLSLFPATKATEINNIEISYQSLFSNSNNSSRASSHSAPIATNTSNQKSSDMRISSMSKGRAPSDISNSSIESILANPAIPTSQNTDSLNYSLVKSNTTISNLLPEPMRSDPGATLGGNSMINLLNDTTDSELPKVGLLFDWNSTNRGTVVLTESNPVDDGKKDGFRDQNNFNLVI